MLTPLLAPSLFFALSASAQLLDGCFYLDASAASPRPAPVECPGQARYEDALPPSPPGTVWLRKRDSREYWSEVLMRAGLDGRPALAFVPASDEPYPLEVMRFDGVRLSRVNPSASDFYTRALVEQALGRPIWAAVSAREGLVVAPGDPKLGALAYARGADGPLFDSAEKRAAQDSLDNAQRALDAGAAQDALPWIDYALSVGPSERASFLRSRALKDAAAPPPIEAPKPAAGRSLVPVFSALAVVLAAGLGGGYWLARRSAPRKKTQTSSSSPGLPKPKGRVVVPKLKRYDVKRKIGSGGMGLVFDATDRSLGRRVAIKQMREELKDQEKEREAFLREAEIVSHLSHPRIVEFHEILREEGDVYLIFEYVEGKPLSQILAEQQKLSLEDARRVFTQVCEAMSFAHKQHVLHRDLKPSNIMITPTGDVKVMDFGVARQAKDTVTKLTNVDAAGTPAYMSPEQHLGFFGKASDIYSLGVCLYEALTGRLPFGGPDFLIQKERMDYLSPQFLRPDLPKEVEVLFRATLAKDPKLRVADAEELIAHLELLKTENS